MFVLVKDSKVVLGPMIWRRNAFEIRLKEDCGIVLNLPSSLEETGTINIAPNVKILPVKEIGISNSYESKTQFLNGPYYNFYDTYAEFYYTAYNKPLDFYKSELKAEVAANRYALEVKGTKVTIQNQEVNVLTSRDDRNLFIQAYQLGKTNVNWKFGDKFLTLTNADLGLIVNAVATYVQAAFDLEAAKFAEIDALTSNTIIDTNVSI